MNNKFSKYVHFLEVGGKHFAFNVKDSSAVALNSKLYRFLTDNRITQPLSVKLPRHCTKPLSRPR